jgi:hypothetical protein
MEGYTMTRNYSKNSRSQLVMNQHALPQLIRHLKKASKLATSGLRVCDFGCSTGLNSCLIFKAALEKLREDVSIPVYITHDDLPNNHWREFFQNAYEVNYMSLPSIYMSIVGKTFHSQLFPDESLHLAYTAISIHWLSAPIECKDHIVCFLSKDQEALEQSRTLARKDLRNILKHRRNELVPGGYFIINTLISYKENATLEFINEFIEHCENTGFLTDKEVRNMVIPLYFHTVDEWKEILNEVSDDYKVKFLEPYNEPAPYWIDFLEHQDRHRYAQESVGYIRSWMERSVRNALERSEEDMEETVKWLFVKLEEYMAEKLNIVTFSTAVIVLERV